MRAHIAMVMAFVAMLGAVAAFQTALEEHETSRLERKLDQGQLLELASRQTYLDQDSIFRQLDDKYRQDVNQGIYFQRQANDLRPKDPVRAASLDLKGQEEFAAARAILPFRDYVYVDSGGQSLENSVEKLAADDLANLGFEVEAPKDAGPRKEAPSMWQGLKETIEKSERKVMFLALAAVIFVISLAMFTFAQLSEPKSRAEKNLQLLGYALAGAALIFALFVEPRSWLNFALAALAFALIGYAGWKLSAKQKFIMTEEEEEAEAKKGQAEEEPCHPGEVDPLLFPGVRIHSMKAEHFFTRAIIVLIAVTAVLSAICGFSYSRSSTKAGQAAAEALEHQVQLFKSSTRPSTATYYVMGTLATTEEIHARYEAARQRAELAEEGIPGVNMQESLAQVGMMKELMSKQPNQNWSILLGSWGPDRDARFPRQWVTESLLENADQDYGLWDAKNELSIAWHKKASTELATITLFAIALYLFGQSLGMGRTHAAFMLVFLSAWLVLLGTARALWVELEPLPSRPHAVRAECKLAGDKDGHIDPAMDAAKHYAAGKKISATATRAEDYARAEKQFQCAVEARPTFALANYYLAEAAWDEGTPQKGEGYVSLTSKESLPEMLKHQDTALRTLDEEGLSRPLRMLGNHGFNSVLLALAAHDRKSLRKSLESTQAALGKDNKAGWVQFNLGMSLLAAGQKDKGLEAYEQGFKQSVNANLAAGSITDLEILLEHCKDVNDAAYCTGIEPEVSKLKTRFAIAWGNSSGTAGDDPQPPGSSRARISDITPVVTPSGVGWHARLQDINLKEDVLTVLWYKHEDDWNVWRVVPAVSGRIYPGEVVEDGNGREFVFRSYLYNTNHHRCLQGGDYRAEFYLNNQRVATPKRIPLSRKPAFEAAGFADINMSLCYPDGWELWHPKDGTNAGLVKGFVDPLGGGGAFLFTYYYPKPGSGTYDIHRLLQRSVNYLIAKNVISPDNFSGGQVPCVLYPDQYPRVCGRFTGTSTNMLATLWFQNDGLVHFGIVFRHPNSTMGFIGSGKAQLMEDEDRGTLDSFTNAFWSLD